VSGTNASLARGHVAVPAVVHVCSTHRHDAGWGYELTGGNTQAVDFPEPLWPIRETHSPAARSRSNPSTAVRSPKSRRSPETRRTGEAEARSPAIEV
jgi:hypothetical protein